MDWTGVRPLTRVELKGKAGPRVPSASSPREIFRDYRLNSQPPNLGHSISHCTCPSQNFTTQPFSHATPPLQSRWVSPGPKSNNPRPIGITHLIIYANILSLSSKKKWAKDPNNNAWSRNTDTFGQKIMRSQGWAPGDYLGAKDASHSEYYGAANASHIRAVLKDDNMGLGAKRNQGDECVGLDAFQELLGRLNGKSEESLDEARKKREEANINKYLHRKLGTVRFVFAGYLVGDKVQALADELKREKEAEDKAKDEVTTEGKKEKKSKKRKVEAEDGTKTSSEKKSKKSKTEDADEDSKARRREKKEKKRREKEASKEDSTEPTAEAEETKNDEISADESSLARKKSKKEKKDKKEKRSKAKDSEEDDGSDSLSKKKKKRKSEKDDETNSAESSVASTPLASGTATPIPHRHLARQRFIAQKRAAVMDQAALNQVRYHLANSTL